MVRAVAVVLNFPGSNPASFFLFFYIKVVTCISFFLIDSIQILLTINKYIISMINLRINTIIRLTIFTTALAWELYKHKVKK